MSDPCGAVSTGPPVQVRIAREPDFAAWQRFVDDNDEASFMHHAGWFGVLRDAFSVTPYFLMAINEKETIEGILPLYLSRSPLTGPHISSLEDGALATTPNAMRALMTRARALRDSTGSRYLQIRGGHANTPADAVQPTVRTIIATSQPIELLWKAINKKTRWAIRQAERQELSIEHDVAFGELPNFYTVYAAHMRDLGTPVFGANVFSAILKHLGPDRLRLYLVRQQRRLVGGMLCVTNANRWTDYYAIVRPAPERKFANYLLYWHVIRDAARTGTKHLDLGRSTPDSNVHHFKQKWRGTDVVTPYSFYVSPKTRWQNLAFGRQKQNKGLLQKCWSQLPLAVANRLGPLIRKQLPFI
jgi:serine/alanine adding enzyme